MAEDESKILDRLSTEVSQLESNVCALAQMLDGYTTEVQEFQYLGEDIRRLESISKTLTSSLDKTVQQMIPKMIEEIDLKNYQLDRLSQSKRNCENQIKAQQEKILQLESQLAAAREHLSSQALGQFESVSWIGSIMGAMLWKSCKQHDSVKSLIGTESLRDFLGMANCVLSSFVTRQGSGAARLSSESEDYKFLATICGALTNLAAFPEGRTHLATETDGLLFANNLLLALEMFRMPEGKLLKRMSLTFVYNICLENNGARFIIGDESRFESVVRCLNLINSEDVLTLTVGLLMRLIKSVPDFRMKAAIASKIPMNITKQIVNTDNPQLKETAAHLLELIEFDWMKAARNNEQ